MLRNKREIHLIKKKKRKFSAIHILIINKTIFNVNGFTLERKIWWNLFFPLNNYKKYIDDHKSFLFALIFYSKLIKGYFMVKDGFTKNLLMFLGYFQVKKSLKLDF